MDDDKYVEFTLEGLKKAAEAIDIVPSEERERIMSHIIAGIMMPV